MLQFGHQLCAAFGCCAVETQRRQNVNCLLHEQVLHLRQVTHHTSYAAMTTLFYVAAWTYTWDWKTKLKFQSVVSYLTPKMLVC